MRAGGSGSALMQGPLNTHEVTMEDDDVVVKLDIWDVLGKDRMMTPEARLRKLAYPDTDIFLLCYSTRNRKSFENAINLWAPEINDASAHHAMTSSRPKPRIILVGTQADPES